MIRHLALVPLLILQLAAVAAQDHTVRSYEKALDLVHAYNGSGPELQQALKLADELGKSAPNSGYSQVLYAEALSTWRLDQNGRPSQVRDQVVELANEALKLNPKLAQAHVSKARALLRSSMYEPANASIDAALALDPQLSGAIFLRADVYRRLGSLSEADTWYRKFINSTPNNSRKANGYSWIAMMYDTAAYNDPENRAAYTAKARDAFESSLKYDSRGPWRNVNFAIFLNDYAADFDTAEKYAQKALGMMEFPMARYHLAAARYQKLSSVSSTMSPEELRDATNKISDSTGISLEKAIAFKSFSSIMADRLTKLQLRISEN